MRVLILTHAFPPDIGGVESFSWALAHGLASQEDVQVSVATWTTATLPNENELAFAVFRTPPWLTLFRLLRQADVVVENSAFLTYLPLQVLAQTKRLRVIHGLQDMQAREASGAARRWLLRRIAAIRQLWTRSADTIVAVSHFVATANHVPRATVIHNGYDPTVFLIKEPAMIRDPHELVVVARLHREKGVDLAIEAARILQERGIPARLTIIGDGQERARLEEQAKALPLDGSVVFTGSLKPSAINDYLNAASIVIVPSRCEEAFGIVALEARAAGCHVVAANIGGLPEAVGTSGILFPPEDASGLANEVASLIRAHPHVNPSRDDGPIGTTNSEMVSRYRAELERLTQRDRVKRGNQRPRLR